MSELDSYSPELSSRQMIVVLTKMDITENRLAAEELSKFIEAQNLPVLRISAISGEGVRELLLQVSKMLKV
jgi:GTPase involved in cell partitioning and DNA repair